ncbi:MAG: NAD(P)-dependent glycerol-1-phosphate dehydrogenase [Methanobacteriota archaeon]
MHSKFMQLPRAVLVGKDAILKADSVCRDLKLDGKALVISGPHTYNIAGERLCSVLGEEHDIEVALVGEASMDEVEKVKNLLHKKKIDFIAGVGGGKVIDIAKLAAKESSLEFVSIPTAASHDGIASSRASIKHNRNTVSIAARAPLGVIADTEIIRKAPYKLTASGCGDVISKFTAVKDWELAHRLKGEEYSEYAATLSLMTAKIIMNSCDVIRKNREEGIRKVVKALISSGVAMSIAGSSRPGSGSEHKFSHALDMIAPKPALHGEQCGVGAIMMMYLHGGDWKKIKNSLGRIGAPTNAEKLGIEEKHIIKALTKAHKIRPSRYTILGKGLTEKKARELASATGVI